MILIRGLVHPIVVVATFVFVSSYSVCSAQEIQGLRLMDEFTATKVASNELATNIYSMTVRPRGNEGKDEKSELFVSGPGYINVLLDKDNDGVFDSTRQFANGPRSGAQGGMAFDGTDLLCTGDGALLRFSDKDKDGVADAPPEEIFKIKTGGEHDAHSIRKGPDGWWYLLAGNGVPILPEYFASSNSPVKDPRAGFLLRISPDWKKKEIYCHGFRNAYDFDFNSIGHVFVYDSDGERDISLPWYRPTRVFRMRPGDDAGFVSRGWKRPSYFFDMPIEIGALGRGSPTGVANCQSQNFPASFHDSIFVADWTFGRVVVFRKDETGGYDRGTDFAIAEGQFGFAVTDLDFDSQGRLLVSVGGRGTEGAIYRIEYVGDDEPATDVVLNEVDAFIKTSNSQRLPAEELIDALRHANSRIRVAAVEALVGRRDAFYQLRLGDRKTGKANKEIVNGLMKVLESADEKTAFLVYRVVRLLGGHSRVEFERALASASTPDVVNGLFFRGASAGDEGVWAVWHAKHVDAGGGESNLGVLTRFGQLGLGDCKADGVDQMFAGYTSMKAAVFTLAQKKRIAQSVLEAIHNESQEKENGNLRGAEELGRLAAMLGFGSVELYEEMTELLVRKDLTVPQEIHWLICLCQSLDERSSGFGSSEVQTKVANSLMGINDKVRVQGLVTDRNFYPNLQSLARRIFQRDPKVAIKVAKEINGLGDDVFLFEALPNDLKSIAIVQFAKRVRQNPNYTTPAQLKVLARHPNGVYLPLLRKFSNRPGFMGVIAASLARDPILQDRPFFMKGLRSADLTTVKNSAIGLRRLFKREDGDELIGAYQAMLKLSWDRPSVSVRDQLMMLIEKHTEESFGYRIKKNNLDQREMVDGAGEWIQTRFPDQFKEAFDGDKSASIEVTLANVDWSKGDPVKGEQVYKRLQCAQCHDGGSRLGPRLEGLSKRFSRVDVFKAILVPNQQVPDRYRALVIETIDGLIYRGSKIYESVDGVTLQLANGSTVRINKGDIETRIVSRKSLMPEGLLEGVASDDLSDLYAFLCKL